MTCLPRVMPSIGCLWVAVVLTGFAGAGSHAQPAAESALPTPSSPAQADPPLDGMVKVFIHEGLPDKLAWPDALPPASESFELHDFILPGIPHKYSNRGIRIDRGNPALARLAARTTIGKDAAGEYRFLLRSLNGGRLIIDGKEVAATPFVKLNANGHERVPPPVAPLDAKLPLLPPGHAEKIAKVQLAAGEHLIVLDLFLGGKKLRLETGEPLLLIARGDGPWHAVSPGGFFFSSAGGWSVGAAKPASVDRWPAGQAVTHELWGESQRDRQRKLAAIDAAMRQEAGAREAAFWKARHDLARKQLAGTGPAVPAATPDYPAHNAVDHFINAQLAAARIKPAPLADDVTFIRRAHLDIVGVVPPQEHLAQLVGELKSQRGGDWRSAYIDRLMSQWADHWVPYWQDVLAENPSLVKPTLNNSGPFRDWIFESLADNKPMDRFATELIRMEGSELGGGPRGFAMASQNDVPMAAKAHVIAKAFLGIEMKCARCHDAPAHPFAQKDLFSMAAMLERKPITVPKTSSVPGTPEHLKRMTITVSLKPGAKVEPQWPASLEPLAASRLPQGLLSDEAAKDTREKLAAIITSPTNLRFAQVLVNRLWKRHMGYGLVEPVDDWENAKPSHPELLDYLAIELATHGYDLKHVAKLILTSHAYQRAIGPTPPQTPKPAERLFAHQVRRRMSAEQVVDSLFAGAGKEFSTEILSFDQDGRRPPTEFLNFGQPRRAWQFVSMSNERDRPALALPMSQNIADVLLAFGWRDSRPDPTTQREEAPNPLQPLTLANGPIVNRIARLSDDSTLTQFAISSDCRTPEEFARRVFRSFLSREPSAAEIKPLADALREGFDSRVVKGAAVTPPRSYRTPVSWANHLNAEATTIKLHLEQAAREGDPPTKRLTEAWRQQAEDVIWAVMNSPEFVFVP